MVTYPNRHRHGADLEINSRAYAEFIPVVTGMTAKVRDPYKFGGLTCCNNCLRRGPSSTQEGFKGTFSLKGLRELQLECYTNKYRTKNKHMSRIPFKPTSETDHRPSEMGEARASIGLDKLIIDRPASTFLLKAGADRYGVKVGDMLVVDRGLSPSKSQLVVVPADNGLILARYPAAEVWGVVTYVIHDRRNG